MEHDADSSIHYDHSAKSNSDLNLQQSNDASIDNETPIPINQDNNCEISITSVIKIMRQSLPDNVKFKDDAKVLFPPYVSKYISFVTKKANEKCKREHRKTLKAEDLFWALENHGFSDYVGPLRSYLNLYHRTKGNVPINSGPRPNHEPRPIPSTEFISDSRPGPVNGPTAQPLNGMVSEPSLGMPQSTLSTPPLAPLSSGQGFSMNTEENLDMVDAPMSLDQFLGDASNNDGSSYNDIGDFDPSVFLNLDFDDI